jgi:hypothetical protein
VQYPYWRVRATCSIHIGVRCKTHYVGYVAALLLLILYLGRLIVLDATSPVVMVPAVLSGFAANPTWYIWLGLEWYIWLGLQVCRGWLWFRAAAGHP